LEGVLCRRHRSQDPRRAPLKAYASGNASAKSRPMPTACAPCPGNSSAVLPILCHLYHKRVTRDKRNAVQRPNGIEEFSVLFVRVQSKKRHAEIFC
jgi:hypothetical protein